MENTIYVEKNIVLTGKSVLITGVADFIGSNLALELIKTEKNIHIIEIDNMNDYYNVSIKKFRLKEISKLLETHKEISFTFIKGDVANKTIVDNIFANYKPAVVIDLAAQAGVRYSITNPEAYIESNIIGFYNIFRIM